MSLVWSLYLSYSNQYKTGKIHLDIYKQAGGCPARKRWPNNVMMQHILDFSTDMIVCLGEHDKNAGEWDPHPQHQYQGVHEGMSLNKET